MKVLFRRYDMDALSKEATELLKQIVNRKKNIFQVRDFDQSKILFFGDKGIIKLDFNKDVFLNELVESGFLKYLGNNRYKVIEADYNVIHNSKQAMESYM